MDSLLPSFMYSYRSFTQGPVNMYNCKDVTVSSSTFENNHAQSVFTDLLSRVSGGGLSITISYDSSSCSVAQRRVSYTIQNCTFSNNSANSTVATAHTPAILSGSYVNDRGGGVAFYVENPIAVTIDVSHCNFFNNTAPYFGGGVYIFSPKGVAEEIFNIANNWFEGNEAASGGGAVLGAPFLQGGNQQQQMNYFNKSMKFTRNTFVKNQAKYGGALWLLPGQYSTQHIV